ncbi:hypothetical protein BKA62DRAFT_696874 [Auriculariales sp. MPI-PUGE-AT-0066]|nr:hypothetical protein BKA62DRAFT_696874 [Auriculariales sp. MPI-PUGE-AT-0066]
MSRGDEEMCELRMRASSELRPCLLFVRHLQRTLDMADRAATRPTRARRADTKVAATAVAGASNSTEDSAQTSRKRKRKAAEPAAPVDEIEYMLTNPKGRLATVDMSRLINLNTWSCLSADSRAILSTMLPSAAFPGFKPALNDNHPGKKLLAKAKEQDGTQSQSQDAMDIHSQLDGSQVELDPSFLSSSYLESAVSTFQDNLVNGYFTTEHRDELVEYSQRLRDGTLHVAWKDDAWDARHTQQDETEDSPVAKPAVNKASLRLLDLAGGGLLLAGDVLSYERKFTGDQIVRKDVMLLRIHPRTLAITVLCPTTTSVDLPSVHLLYDPNLSEPLSDRQGVEEMPISHPAQLETAILRMVAQRMPRSSPADAQEAAWQAFTVWRSKSDNLDNLGEASTAEKGGRVVVGTLVSLRDRWLQSQ